MTPRQATWIAALSSVLVLIAGLLFFPLSGFAAGGAPPAERPLDSRLVPTVELLHPTATVTATATRTKTAVAPVATSVPPTRTPVPPTATPAKKVVPPTATQPVVATATSVPPALPPTALPTSTPVTPVGVTAPVPGTATATPALALSGKPAINIDQCANGGVGSPPVPCTGSAWQNGNLNGNQAHYYEGDSVPYRVTVSDLTPGQTYTVTLSWATTKSGKHAIDYLTTYNRTELSADPCSAAGFICGGTTSTLPIPVDPNVTGSGVTPIPGVFTLFGGTFPVNATSAYALAGPYSGDSDTSISVSFVADSTNAVLAWGGHIASRADWGLDNSAAYIDGSPYHMAQAGFSCSNVSNCGAGAQDRSLKSAAIILPGKITVVKDAVPDGATSFSFTASPAPLANFSLVDNGTPANTIVFDPIITFTTYAISESLPSGWSLTAAACTTVNPNGGSFATSGTRVTIDLREGEFWVCTFTNTQAPTPTPTSTNTPTNTPTATPTDTPTATPTNTPTATPTDTPTATPTDTPTATPTDTPTATPTNTPTATPTDTPTATPTDTPTATPTDTPTATPTNTPTATPTDTPTATPTDTPTATPTATPTNTPTATPTDTPTATPTATPTDTPTATPTNTPTATPTQCVVGAIHGVVVDGLHNDAPIANASVVILGPGGAQWNLTTDANGLFSLSPAPNGAYTIMASAVGYQGVAQASANVNCSDASVLLRLTPNEEQQPTPTPTNTPVPPTATPTSTPTPTIPVLPPTSTPTRTPTQCVVGALQGTVVDGANADAPIAGASVVIVGTSATYTATTNAAGFFSRVGLPNGVYTVMASAAGYQGVAQVSVTIDCNLAIVVLRLTPNQQQQPTPTPTVRPTEPPDTDPTPTPVPPAPTPTPPLPPTLPKTGDVPLGNPAAHEWLLLALLVAVCGAVGWRGGGAWDRSR